MNHGDLVFEEIAENLFVMVANRYNKEDLQVYSKGDFDELKLMGYKVEIRPLTYYSA